MERHTVLKFKNSGINLLIPGEYVIIKDEDIVSDIKEMYGLKPKIEELGILETNNSFNSITFFYPEKGRSMDFNEILAIDMAATGENIARLRENAGLSVKDLQEIFSFATPQAIYKWQHGDTMPTIDNLVVLTSVFEINMDEIIRLEVETGTRISA